MRFFKIFAFSMIFFCLSNAGTLKADAYLRGFQALEQRDYKTALYYLSLFAANGDTKANYNLGIMYREGLGVEKNDVQSLTHLITAAENGHMLANYAVGLAFLTGKGSDILTPLENIEFNGQKLKVFYYDKYGNSTDRPEFSKPLPEGLTAKSVMDGYIESIGGKDKLEGVKTKASILEASMQGMTIQLSNRQTTKKQRRGI